MLTPTVVTEPFVLTQMRAQTEIMLLPLPMPEGLPVDWVGPGSLPLSENERHSKMFEMIMYLDQKNVAPAIQEKGFDRQRITFFQPRPQPCYRYDNIFRLEFDYKRPTTDITFTYPVRGHEPGVKTESAMWRKDLGLSFRFITLGKYVSENTEDLVYSLPRAHDNLQYFFDVMQHQGVMRQMVI